MTEPTLDRAAEYLDRVDPGGTRSLAALLWAVEQIKKEDEES